MLRHRYIVALFILFMLLPFSVDYFSQLPLLYFVLVILIFLSLEFYGATYIQSNFHLKAICSFNTKEKQVVLSFDDGPNSETNKILDVLKEYNYKAVFFCIGKNIKGNEDILKRIDAEGHLIGNHSFEHGFFFDMKGSRAMKKEIEETSETIKRIIGKTPRLFRPPYGVTTPAMARTIRKLKYTVIGWNIRSFDTSTKEKAQVLERIKKGLKRGSIILLHDTLPGNSILLKDLLNYLRSENYTSASLDSILTEKAYA